MRKAKYTSWLVGGGLTLGLAVYLTFALRGENARVFLPGQTTHGHYQIELACGSCHAGGFASKEDMQSACEGCHADELRRAKDAHPKSKFRDPRNAARIEVLDARYCVTCHAEHRPELVTTMGVTLPTDLCIACHDDIADDRPSHRGMAFDTCTNVGCHNFHDNRALYEDFVAKHLDAPSQLERQVLPTRMDREPSTRSDLLGRWLVAADADAPSSLSNLEAIREAWAESAHARAGLNCTGCHSAGADAPASFVPSIEGKACARCHAEEQKGFESGKHGMRLAVGLDPMRPEEARLPMHASAHGRGLGCTSCHDAHRVDVRAAAVDACLGCHDDEHSRAFRGSPHGLLWELERDGLIESGAGVSCGTCHLPRITEDGVVRVEHNQNEYLRPREKMIREVCQSCHGLPFVLDALADEALVRSNFAGRPSVHVATPEMVRARLGRLER